MAQQNPGSGYFAPTYFGGTTPQFADLTVPAPGGYFAPSYFGPSFFAGPAGSTPPGAVVPDPPSPPEVQPSESALMRWISGQLTATGAFHQVYAGRNPAGMGAAGDTPTAWVYPVGFGESNDASDLSIRQSTLAVVILVATDNDDDGQTYDQLGDLAALVVDAVEAGPPWVTPSTGGLKSGRYDTPPQIRQNTSSPVSAGLGLTLLFAYGWLRMKRPANQ